MENLGTKGELAHQICGEKELGQGKPQSTVPRAQHRTDLMPAAVKLNGPWMGTDTLKMTIPCPHPQPSMSTTALILDLKYSPVEEPTGNTKTGIFSSVQRRLKMELSFPLIFFRLKCDCC